MQKNRGVLIVEDNELNREILAEILDDTYVVYTAENGAEGIDVLRSHIRDISLILLDIQMPIMNGYEFLEATQNDTVLASVPIIVTTAGNTDDEQMRCLDMGASDFVGKPYNPEIVKKRVASMIHLSETTSMLSRIERDPDTKAYSKEAFFAHAAELLAQYPTREYDMICFEVESYRSLYRRHGIRTCNAFLKALTNSLITHSPEDAIIGRIGEDLVGMFVEHVPMSAHEDMIDACLREVNASNLPHFELNAGIYCCVDPSLSMSTIFYNAHLPIDDIRYRYSKHVAEFDDSIRQKLDKNQLLTDTARGALQERQFQVYYQPKIDADTNAIAGAEALIRWIHPEMGFMNPGEFIPLFETNGFIYEVDKYVLDQVCRDLKRWETEGKPRIPVSVNVSQVDFENPDLADIFDKIVRDHDVSHELIHLEITESADAADKNRKAILVRDFKDKGFVVELDDFGAGYSSLATLGELPIDILKVDMSLVRHMHEPKYKAVLQSVLLTAANMHFPAVIEGIEDADQLETLIRMGEGRVKLYVQGYYFSKPLPLADFEEYMTAHM